MINLTYSSFKTYETKLRTKKDLMEVFADKVIHGIAKGTTVRNGFLTR